MLKDLHKHMLHEIQQSTKTDTVFVVSTVLIDLIVFGINWAVANENGNGSRPGSNDIILIVLIVAIIVINFVTIKAIASGKNIRLKLVTGLINMYKDNDVAKYYDSDLLKSYSLRNVLYTAILLTLAAIAIIVPLLERIF